MNFSRDANSLLNGNHDQSSGSIATNVARNGPRAPFFRNKAVPFSQAATKGDTYP